MTELSGDCSDDVMAAAIMQIAPGSIHVDLSHLSAMLADVAGVRQRLTSPHIRDLILIRSSPRLFSISLLINLLFYSDFFHVR